MTKIILKRYYLDNDDMTDIVTCPEDGYFSYEASHKHNMHKLLNSIMFKLHAN